jgi:hypothetical protein
LFRQRLAELEATMRAGGLRPVPNGPGSLRHIQELELRAAALELGMAEAIEDINVAVERIEAVVFPKSKQFRAMREKRLGSPIENLAPVPQVAPPVVAQSGRLPPVQGVMRIAPPAVSSPVPHPAAPGPMPAAHQYPGPTPQPVAQVFPPGVPAEVLAAATGVPMTAEERAAEAARNAPKVPRADVTTMKDGRPWTPPEAPASTEEHAVQPVRNVPSVDATPMRDGRPWTPSEARAAVAEQQAQEPTKVLETTAEEAPEVPDLERPNPVETPS